MVKKEVSVKITFIRENDDIMLCPDTCWSHEEDQNITAWSSSVEADQKHMDFSLRPTRSNQNEEFPCRLITLNNFSKAKWSASSLSDSNDPAEIKSWSTCCSKRWIKYWNLWLVFIWLDLSVLMAATVQQIMGLWPHFYSKLQFEWLLPPTNTLHRYWGWYWPY